MRQSDILKVLGEGLKSIGCNNNYLELGIRNCGTFNVVAPFFKNAYAVDIDKESANKIATRNAKWFCKTTDEFISSLKDEKFDLVFIDADHSYEQSLKDFMGISNFVSPNGLITLHDSYPESDKFLSPNKCGGVYKTAWDIRTKMASDFEIITLPFCHGVSIIRKANKQLMWK